MDNRLKISWPTQIVQVYLQPFRRNSLALEVCAEAENYKKK